jgi:ribosomal protein S18 acetylase RimI-like enzyme
MQLKRSRRQRQYPGRSVRLALAMALHLCTFLLLSNLRLVFGFATVGSQRQHRELLPRIHSDYAVTAEVPIQGSERSPSEADEPLDGTILLFGDDSLTSSGGVSNERWEGRPRSDNERQTPCGDVPLSEEEQVERVKARAVEMFGRRMQSRIAGTNASSSTKKTKGTSVGKRRVGSATRARQGTKATEQIMDVVRKTARGVSATGQEKENSDPLTNDDPDSLTPRTSLSSRLTASVVQSAIASILRGPTLTPPSNSLFRRASTPGLDVLTNVFASFESVNVGAGVDSLSPLRPGSILLPPSDASKGATSVYIATCHDDANVASLRLSVFSDFTREMQNQFHARSCQAIQSRRLRGAVCLVAKSSSGSVLGSAECSFHEFFDTRLGQKRPRNSILYVTEVAVNASVRRQGIGIKLLQAADALGKLRGVETLYLHVDTMNLAALRLYEKAGYRAAWDGRDPERDSVFAEFTRSLNLHPGATQGRDHFLLCKDLVPNPTWLSDEAVKYKVPQARLRPPVGVLGFEIPA